MRKPILNLFLIIGLVASLFLSGCGSQTSSTPTSPWVKESGIRISTGDCVSVSVIKLSNGDFRAFFGGESVKSAVSSDEGWTWTIEDGVRLEKDPANSYEARSAGNPSVIQISGETYRMYYEGRSLTGGPSKNGEEGVRRILSAVSTDEGFTWTKEGLILDAAEEDNYFLSVPDIIKLPDGNYRLYFVSAGFSIKSATSPDGINFTRDGVTILGSTDPSDAAIDPDVVIAPDGKYKLYYTAGWSAAYGGPTKIMSATSTDGLHFTEDNVILLSAGGANDQALMVDADIIQLSNGKYRMFYGGSNDGQNFNLLSAIAETISD